MGTPTALTTLSKRTAFDVNREFFVDDPEFAAAFPECHDLLFRRKVGDVVRHAAKLTIFVDAGILKVAVSCPFERVVGFYSLQDPTQVWDVLERKLSDGTMDWKEDKDKGGARR